MATAHLIHGYIGAGKTTFARRLETELPAVRFTHDEGMARFFRDTFDLLKSRFEPLEEDEERIDLGWH